jgi:hypothetical protein
MVNVRFNSLLVATVCLIAVAQLAGCKGECDSVSSGDTPCPVDCDVYYATDEMMRYVLFNEGSTWRYVNQHDSTDTLLLTADGNHLGRNFMGQHPENECKNVFLTGFSYTSEEVSTSLNLETGTNNYSLLLGTLATKLTDYKNIRLVVYKSTMHCSSIDGLFRYIFAADNSNTSDITYQTVDTVWFDQQIDVSYDNTVFFNDTTYNKVMLVIAPVIRQLDIDSAVIVPSIGLYAFKLCGQHYKLSSYSLR